MSSEEEPSDLVLQPLSINDICNLYNTQEANHHGEPTDHHNSIIFSIAMGIKRKNASNEQNVKVTKELPPRSTSDLARLKWKSAAKKVLYMEDPWSEFHLERLDTELAVRYRYNALTKSWVTDKVLVKIDREPFGRGAMRECYRLKKLSSFSHNHNWTSALNYVAKRYMENVDRNVYFEDIKLQMDAKLWGEEFNRHNPPKKVDIFQVSVLEFVNRSGKPLYHLEHFIEGKYIKYNSNSGFISCDNMRLTPQAFSHFTFERSGHELIVVDIQGVGDLYTDPQIHTTAGTEYGDGNLGVKGMALFFYSHVCNCICEGLGLTQFDKAPLEAQSNQTLLSLQKSSKTRIRGREELCISMSEYEKSHLSEVLCSRRQRTYSSPPDLNSSKSFSPGSLRRQDSGFRSMSNGSDDTNDDPLEFDLGSDTEEPELYYHPAEHCGYRQRHRYDSESSSTMGDENDRVEFQRLIALKARPSCVMHEAQVRQIMKDQGHRFAEKSILGQIHLELVKYYQSGRFNKDGSEEYDQEAALFHLEQAAACGNLEAILTLSRIYLHLPHDLLADISVPDSPSNVSKGMDFLVQAAYSGDRASMISVAKAFDTGINLNSERKQDWTEAVYWYNLAVITTDEDEGGEYDGCMDDPAYLLLARQAEMYQLGKFTLEKNFSKAGELYQQAAEAAMAAMKGRLANKYYMQAEEALAQAETE